MDNEWYDTKEALLGLDDKTYKDLQIPDRIVKLIKTKLNDNNNIV